MSRRREPEDAQAKVITDNILSVYSLAGLVDADPLLEKLFKVHKRPRTDIPKELAGQGSR
jgi:hypothetical protein